MQTLLENLSKLLGSKGLLIDDALKDHPASVFIQPLALIRPCSSQELSDAMKLCHAANQPVVAQGGRTGMVNGQLAQSNEIVVSLELMNSIEKLDCRARTMTVEAGTILQTIQETADQADLMFPLDLGARGSATIGGNIATNAGGNRVVRFGMTREMVLGVEAVLADGTIISSMNSVLKNNTGYDLKQLFIGSEGTLGIVTRAILRLRPKARSQNTALLAVDNFEKLIALLGEADAALGGSMSSFEVMWNNFYQHTTDGGNRHRQPLSDHYPYYVIIEAMGSNQCLDDERFNAAMESLFELELISDAVIAQSQKERESIWEIRDDVESLMSLYPFFTYDISLPLESIHDYVEDVKVQLTRQWPESHCIVFGHLGDGNIHLIIAMGNDSIEAHGQVDTIVYSALRHRSGVISAEHGIGLEKKPHLNISRSSNEINLMRVLKSALDPKDILNRGKIF